MGELRCWVCGRTNINKHGRCENCNSCDTHKLCDEKHCKYIKKYKNIRLEIEKALMYLHIEGAGDENLNKTIKLLNKKIKKILEDKC